MAGVKLLIIDGLGFLPLSTTGTELIFEMIFQLLVARKRVQVHYHHGGELGHGLAVMSANS